MSQPVTTNPILIMVINMTVVFAVLWGLSLVIRLTKMIDPTQKKKLAETSAPAATAAVAVAEPAVQQDDTAIVAVIAAALAAYGYNQSQIASIRRVDGHSWAQVGRLDAVNARTQMY